MDFTQEAYADIGGYYGHSQPGVGTPLYRQVDQTVIASQERLQRRRDRTRENQRYRRKKIAEKLSNKLAGTPGDVEFQRQIKKWRVRNGSHRRRSSGSIFNKMCKDINGIRVFVRKRPISKKEIKRNDYDVTSVDKGTNAVVHAPKLLVDGITKVLSNQTFPLDGAFDVNVKNDTVFKVVARPLFDEILKHGGNAMCFAFGQTGSGKTHTITGIQDYLVQHVFDFLNGRPDMTLQLSYYEIYGNRVFDLLNKGNEVHVREDARKNIVRVRGIVYRKVGTEDDFIQYLKNASKARVTKATRNNATSSRSHAVAQLQFIRRDPGGGNGSLFGRFTLVDLAGSERHDDSKQHSSELQLESAAINTSLLALKECIRCIGSKAKPERVPYRSSKLTMILKDCFVDEKLKVSVIATISPSASNSEHTVNTLKYACLLRGEKDSVSDIEMVQMKPAKKRSRKSGNKMQLTLLKRKLKKVHSPPEKKHQIGVVDSSPTHWDDTEGGRAQMPPPIEALKRETLNLGRKMSGSLLTRQNSMREKISDSPVLVIVRIRPLSETEQKHGEQECVQTLTKSTLRIRSSENDDSLTRRRTKGIGHTNKLTSHLFKYDSILNCQASQDRTYGVTAHLLVDKVLEGFNSTIFAYGQTGAGKTHTMMGSKSDPGVMLSMTEEIMERLNLSDSIQASFIEIYDEKIYDLWTYHTPYKKGKQGLRRSGHQGPVILETPGGGIVLQNTRKRTINSIGELKEYIWGGFHQRTSRATKMNADSSRSHAILILYVKTKHGTVKVNLCDLAGSERQKKTGATGRALREAVSINQSLSSLGTVVLALTNRKMHIPYRNSILTRMLQDSLGGNAYTMIIANVSPAAASYEETLSTLRFASRVKNVKNAPLKAVVAPPTLRTLLAKNRYLEAKVNELEQKLKEAEGS
eukprot:g2101.t1